MPLFQRLGSRLASLFLSVNIAAYMYETEDVSLACIVACDSAGVNIAQSAHIKFDVLPKFIRFTQHSLACSKSIRLLKLHSV